MGNNGYKPEQSPSLTKPPSSSSAATPLKGTISSFDGVEISGFLSKKDGSKFSSEDEAFGLFIEAIENSGLCFGGKFSTIEND